MSIYLGQLGRMVEIKCPASQQVNTADGYTFEETLEGRVKAQVRPIRRRTWSLGTSDATTPGQQATLQGFSNGSWGPGPFVFVSADAPVTNLLTPDATVSKSFYATVGIESGGPVDLGNLGWEGNSVVNNGPLETPAYLGTEMTPVLPGIAVTGSAFVRGAAVTVRLFWYDMVGAFVSAVSSAPVTSESEHVRVTVTGAPPSGAVACKLVIYGRASSTRAAVTWTDQAFDWAAGEGCPRAVIHEMSKSLVMASREPDGGRYANLSYTITEVG